MGSKTLDAVTLIVPFYRNSEMLRRQLFVWNQYAPGMRVIVIDDGSPEAALPIVQEFASPDLLRRLKLYRINTDIPWNRGGARNLGAYAAETEWIVHIDIDHVLLANAALALLNLTPKQKNWYRFERYRIGRADETRRKDKIPDDAEYGQIHEHVDSYLCTRTLYWKVGGYDEDYSGCLGGGSPFLRQLEEAAPVKMLPPETFLQVFTRGVVADASDYTLSRDTREYTRRRQDKERRGATKSTNTLRFAWERVL